MGNEKWSRLLSLAKHFKRIPFVDFVLLAGSMALGEERDDSDFDVIVGARSGRIFTVRFFSYLWFGFIGARRGRGESGTRAKDKLCFSHFVTEASYRLAPPYNPYWVELYRHLIPLYDGFTKHITRPIDAFFAANADWSGTEGSPTSFLRLFTEKLLDGRIGDALERFLKKIQLKKIERHIAGDKGYKPHVRYDDEELRFHMDTRRVDEWVNRWYNRGQ